jgi:hypothetical protein
MDATPSEIRVTPFVIESIRLISLDHPNFMQERCESGARNGGWKQDQRRFFRLMTYCPRLCPSLRPAFTGGFLPLNPFCCR